MYYRHYCHIIHNIYLNIIKLNIEVYVFDELINNIIVV